MDMPSFPVETEFLGAETALAELSMLPQLEVAESVEVPHHLSDNKVKTYLGL